MSHTFAEMEVSGAVFNEIRHKLKQAGYDQAILITGDTAILDMHGIGLVNSCKHEKARRDPADGSAHCPECGCYVQIK